MHKWKGLQEYYSMETNKKMFLFHKKVEIEFRLYHFQIYFAKVKINFALMKINFASFALMKINFASFALMKINFALMKINFAKM